MPPISRLVRRAAFAGVLIIATSCGDGPTEPPPTELEPLIAFAYKPVGQPARIAVMTPSGDDLRVVTSGDFEEYSPAWHRDGQSLTFSSWRADFSRLYTVPLAEGGEGTLVPSGEWAAYEADWSPDGARLVFEATGRSGRDDLFIVTIATDAVHNLTDSDEDERQPHWSPDGERIVYSRGLNGERQIYSMRVDGTDVRRLTAIAGEHSRPRYRPST